MTEGPKFYSDAGLTKLSREILESAGNIDDVTVAGGAPLSEARATPFRIMFSSKKSDRFAGKCYKVDEALRTIIGFDFYIIIYKPNFDEQTQLDKVHTVAHELHHIMLDDEDRPRIRRHNGEFCEIRSHDQFPAALAKRILPDLLKGETLKTFETQKVIA